MGEGSQSDAHRSSGLSSNSYVRPRGNSFTINDHKNEGLLIKIITSGQSLPLAAFIKSLVKV